MKKRNIIISSLLYLSLGGLISFSLAAFNLNFIGINIQSINQKTSDIIFRASGNDFMGSIFWLNAKSIDGGKTINIAGQAETKICYKQVKGMYYNSQRGNRLRPLDEDTLEYFKISSNTYSGLTITGGLYTSCSGDEYGMYGQIKHSVDAMDYYIVAGTKYNWDSNTISGEFAKSFQRFDNKFPIGYIYDNRGGGIGFIGGSGNANQHRDLIEELNSGSGINQLFKYDGNNIRGDAAAGGISIETTKGNAINTLMNAGVQGTIGFSFSANTIENKSIIGNLDRRTIIFNTLNINLSKLLNEVRKNSESLCKDKYVPRSQVNNSLTSRNVFCIENSNIIINTSTDRDNLKDKVIVLNSGNIIIAQGMTASQGPVSIFIEKGKLLVENDTSSAINFDANGYATSNPGVSKGIYLKGNFIVNGLIIGADLTGPNNRIQTGFKHKLFFNGKVASLNTPSYPSQGRLDHVKSLFGNTGSNSWIWLGNTFKWQCNPVTGSGSDNGFTPCNDPADRNAMLPLIIIDGYYPSSLIK